jgi:hypothetical protein
MQNLFKMERSVEFKGEKYLVVDELPSDFLLVIKDEEAQEAKYPIQTYIIPDEN